jgi:Family of unknown function (DUF5715)
MAKPRFLIMGMLFFMSMLATATTKTFPANRGSVAAENAAADAAGIPRYADEEEMQRDVASGILVPIPITPDKKLPVNRRYVRVAAANFMLDLDTDFNRQTGHYLIVDSAVRPVSIQKSLIRRNQNAAPAFGERASSHERGTTFDLARKSWYPTGSERMTRSQWAVLRTELLYYRAIGRIFVIEERACIHVMVREDL